MNKIIENRVDTIFVHVTDLKRSAKWYGELLGLVVEEDKLNDPIYTFNMGEGRPGLTLDCHCFDEEYCFTPSNQPMFNLSTSDINEAFSFVTHMGAEIVSNIITYPDLAEFSFKDPDGNIIMVCSCFSS